MSLRYYDRKDRNVNGRDLEGDMAPDRRSDYLGAGVGWSRGLGGGAGILSEPSRDSLS